MYGGGGACCCCFCGDSVRGGRPRRKQRPRLYVLRRRRLILMLVRPRPRPLNHGLWAPPQRARALALPATSPCCARSSRGGTEVHPEPGGIKSFETYLRDLNAKECLNPLWFMYQL